MAASKVWHCSSNLASLVLLRSYIELCKFFEFVVKFMYFIYFWCMSELYESQVMDIYFYNLETQQKVTVLNQSHVLWVMFMLLLKTAFKIRYSCSNESVPLPIHKGFFEFHYYTKEKWTTWISREYDDTLNDSYSRTGSYLYASVNGCANITAFVNEYIGSFNAYNAITSDELADLTKMKLGGKVPVVKPATVLLMEDNTLEEHEFTGDDVIVLI